MVVKENISDFADYLKNILLKLDKINGETVTISICEK